MKTKLDFESLPRRLSVVTPKTQVNKAKYEDVQKLLEKIGCDMTNLPFYKNLMHVGENGDDGNNNSGDIDESTQNINEDLF